MTTDSDIQRVGVVGCGLMGSGIAEVCARAGLDVLVREVNQDALEAGRRRIQASLAKAAAAGKLICAVCITEPDSGSDVAAMSTTILDRLMHHCQLLEFDGGSYRLTAAAEALARETMSN